MVSTPKSGRQTGGGLRSRTSLSRFFPMSCWTYGEALHILGGWHHQGLHPCLSGVWSTQIINNLALAMMREGRYGLYLYFFINLWCMDAALFLSCFVPPVHFLCPSPDFGRDICSSCWPASALSAGCCVTVARLNQRSRWNNKPELSTTVFREGTA